jgi:gliding motility-associated-like protein
MNLAIVANPTVSLSNVTICDSQTIPTLTAGTQANNATYQWSNGSGAIAGATNNSYTPTVAGNYSVVVSVSPGCTGSGNMALVINTTPVYSLNDQTICTDGQAKLDPNYTTGSYLWSTGATTQSITTNVQGEYYLTITENGCAKRDSAYLTVDAYPAKPVLSCGSGSTLSPAFTYLYSWAAVPGAVSYEVSEDNGVTWAASNAANGPETHATNNSVPYFLVRAIGGGLCKTGYPSEPTACQVTAPNVINPNSTKTENSFFKITNIEQYPNNKVQIFNRWGKEIFTASPYDNASKSFNGKDVPAGTYFYIINMGQDGQSPLTGTLTIIK